MHLILGSEFRVSFRPCWSGAQLRQLNGPLSIPSTVLLEAHQNMRLSGCDVDYTDYSRNLRKSTLVLQGQELFCLLAKMVHGVLLLVPLSF